MPVTPTYPGVYIQEVDSGSRVVSGVATAITAFIGRAPLGPANVPTTVFDYGEFQKLFGGRTRDLPMTYAVEDFFNNGGSEAIIVRVCPGAPRGTPSTFMLSDAYKLTTKLTGPISEQVVMTAVESTDKPGTYDISFLLGGATSKVVLAELTSVPPEAVDMKLKSLKDVVKVDFNGEPIAPDDMVALLKKLPGTFKGGSAANSLNAKFLANSGDPAIEVNTTVEGAWIDDLDLSIVPKGSAGDTFQLIADHPAFQSPYVREFTTWDDLDAVKTETGFLAIGKKPTLANTTTIGKWVGKGVPLTRVPDGAGSAASMLQVGPLVLMASSPGEWGNVIGVSFDKQNITDDAAARFVDYGIDDSTDFWNVNVYYPLKKGQVATSPAETIGPVYLGPLDAPCRIDHMLTIESQYLSARPPIAAASGRDLAGARVLDPAQVGLPKGDSRLGMLGQGQDGTTLSSDIILGNESARTGLYALELSDLFNTLVIVPDPLLNGDLDMISIYAAAAPYCAKRRAILIADPLDKWSNSATKSQFDRIMPTDFAINEITSRRSVFTYFPRVKKPDPARGNREMTFSASGIIAGIFAGTDLRRGVWKAPAGIEAGMNGVTNLEHRLTDMQNGVLNQVGVNVLRDFPIIGKVVWGSRTLAGADALSDDYKYLPVRRLTNYVEESLYRGTKFAVFEPNAEPLWAQLRMTVGTFMADLARQGAFYDYFVNCDKSTTTQFDIDRGRVNVIVGMAPVKPAEFVILTIQQLAGQTAS